MKNIRLQEPEMSMQKNGSLCSSFWKCQNCINVKDHVSGKRGGRQWGIQFEWVHSQKREIIHCFDLLSNSSSYSKSPQVHQSFIFDQFNHLRWLWKTLSLWGKSGKGKTVQNCTSPFCPAIQVLLKAPALVCFSDFCWEYYHDPRFSGTF